MSKEDKNYEEYVGPQGESDKGLVISDNSYRDRNVTISRDKIKEILDNHYPDVAVQKLYELLEEI